MTTTDRYTIPGRPRWPSYPGYRRRFSARYPGKTRKARRSR